jgi:hypothetical protein
VNRFSHFVHLNRRGYAGGFAAELHGHFDFSKHLALQAKTRIPKILSFAPSLSVVATTADMARYYAMSIEPNLFGEVCLMWLWGRIGSRGQK